MTDLLRSNLIVAAGTALSRVTGLGRILALSYVLGRTALSDAYTLANETPNIVYDLLIGGVLSATLVPLFTSLRTADGDDDRDAVASVTTVAMTAIVALTLVSVFAAPWIFGIYSQQVSASVDATAFRSAGTTLTRVFLIQILFYGLSGIANAYLNSRRRFFAAAWSPVLSNLIIIVTLLSLPSAGSATWSLADLATNERLRYTLGWGATAGIAAMAICVVPAMVGAGFRPRWRFDMRHPAVKQLLGLSGWTFGFVVANQVALAIIRNITLGGDAKWVTSYYAAFVFFVLPHGLLAVSISTTFQPELARAVVDDDRDSFARHLSTGVRMIALLTLPASAGLLVLREPIIGLLMRGQFGIDDVVATAPALAGLAVGLPAFSIYLFVLRGFYAHHDTRTPFVLNLGENALNVVLAVVFVRWWGLFGLGLAYSVAYIISSVVALLVLSRTAPEVRPAAIVARFGKLGVATLLMAAAVWGLTHWLSAVGGWLGAIHLGICALVGAVVYAALLMVLRTPELVTLRSRVRRR